MSDSFVHWFRQASPYIHAHRGTTMVVAFGGEAVRDARFPSLIHDLALLHALGVRLVLVHGTRPQIEERLARRGARMEVMHGLRVTDDEALRCVMEAAGTVQVEIEARLSMGLANSPMAGARIEVTSGNFVTARPLGILDGVDYQHTGEVRRINAGAIDRRLAEGAVVLIPPLGYSPTGEVFNLNAADVATEAALALKADKLIFLMDHPLDEAPSSLLPTEAETLIGNTQHPQQRRVLANSVRASRGGVGRIHLLSRHIDGVLLRELFTRDGIGTLVCAERWEQIRPATIDDVGGILELIEPLEAAGVLVRRSREKLETEIDHFVVIERDGTIIGCAALYPFREERLGELACVAVHPDYRDSGRGDELLAHMEREARRQGLTRLFVLTTRTAHWFRERGFEPAGLEHLPAQRRDLYNWQRNSRLFLKPLESES